MTDLTSLSETKPSIAILMKARNKTCRALAAEIGVSASLVSRWSTHTAPIGNAWRSKLATALRTTKKKIAESSK